MSHRSSGYNVDVTYTHGYFPDTRPAWLDFIATFDGMACPQGDGRYLELGCGTGEAPHGGAVDHALSLARTFLSERRPQWKTWGVF